MGITSVPTGEIATIVTYLDMRERPRPAPMPSSTLKLKRWSTVDCDKYRALFTRVGAPWLWFSRLVLDDATRGEILGDPGVEAYAVEDPQRIEVGMLELDFRQPGDCEIGYFGLVPEATGQGHGGWLMAQALASAWRAGIDRVHLHTCTLDHPVALGFYIASGFTPRGCAIETFADPRLIGLLPRDSAPQIPLLG